MTFTAIWAVVKGFLDEKTRGKIKILGSNFLPTLEQYWDRNNMGLSLLITQLLSF